MKKRLIYTLLTCVMLSSCKKNELPKNEEEAGTPVFYFKCNVNGVPMKIEAGKNTYAMQASHFQDKNNLYVYESQLKQATCSGNCSYAMSVQINDVMLRELNAAQEVNSALSVGIHPYNDGVWQPVFYRGLFRAEKDDGDYLWTFSNDNSTVQGREVEKIFQSAGSCTVKLDYDNIGGLGSESLTKKFKIGSHLQAYIKSTFDASTLKYKFSSSTEGDGFKYLWDFGSNGQSSSPGPELSFSSPHYNNPTLTLINSKNDTCVTKYQIRDTSAPNANYISTFTPFLNPKLASAITIGFTDQNGVNYSSANINQPVSSRFEIISVEPYKNNEKNEATKKVKIKFNCSFTSANGPINLTDGEAVIAVSYK
ncbi:MAG: hypothetical protein V4635_00400 [Bacteroidota bacterium]